MVHTYLVCNGCNQITCKDKECDTSEIEVQLKQISEDMEGKIISKTTKEHPFERSLKSRRTKHKHIKT